MLQEKRVAKGMNSKSTSVESRLHEAATRNIFNDDNFQFVSYAFVFLIYLFFQTSNALQKKLHDGHGVCLHKNRTTFYEDGREDIMIEESNSDLVIGNTSCRAKL